MLSMFNLTFPFIVISNKRNFDFSMSNVADYSKSLTLLQKEMFTCTSDDIKPIGYVFNSASSIC